jgi:excisionase family DNA binding protein
MPENKDRTTRSALNLLTPDEAAARLRCSRRTLAGLIRAGALRYVIIGCGTKRPRKMFTDLDLDECIARQTRREVPCPPAATRGRRSPTGPTVAFTALRSRRMSEKPGAVDGRAPWGATAKP